MMTKDESDVVLRFCFLFLVVVGGLVAYVGMSVFGILVPRSPTYDAFCCTSRNSWEFEARNVHAINVRTRYDYD